MLKALNLPYVAYGLLLLGFVSLGAFVAALAFGSPLAVVAGLALVASFAGAVVGFRAGARRLAHAAPTGDSAVSIFSIPLRRDEVDRYLQSYRGEHGTEAEVTALTDQPRELATATVDGPRHRAA